LFDTLKNNGVSQNLAHLCNLGTRNLTVISVSATRSASSVLRWADQPPRAPFPTHFLVAEHLSTQ